MGDFGKRILTVLVMTMLAVFVMAGCSGGGGASNEPSQTTDEPSQTTDEPASTAASNDNLPLPDFSELFMFSKEAARDYLAETYFTPTDQPEYFYSSQSHWIAADSVEDYNMEWEDGSWILVLSSFDSDDEEPYDSIEVYFPYLSTYEDELAPCETYGKMLESYFGDQGIKEMTVAWMDRDSGEKNYHDRYDGYILFGDCVAQVYDYSVTVYPADTDEFDWQKVKSRIDEGYYSDVHSGGITYEYPYIDVYSMTGSAAADTPKDTQDDASGNAAAGSIAGTWKVYEFTMDGETYSHDDVVENNVSDEFVIRFNGDGSAKITVSGEDTSCTWKANGDNGVSIVFDDGTLEGVLKGGRLSIDFGAMLGVDAEFVFEKA